MQSVPDDNLKQPGVSTVSGAKAASGGGSKLGGKRIHKSLSSSRYPNWLFALFLVAATLAAYFPALRGGFIWDDDAYVTGNLTLRNLHGLHRIWFEVGAVPQYYPMVHTTFWLEYHLWGLNPLGYHLINILLHAVAAVLLWQVLRRLSIPGSWLAAVIFALHPIEVESVSWVTECKNVLSAFFYFAAALAYLRFIELGTPGGSNQRRWPWYLGALLLFLAALLSKTVACSLPAALLLVCWWKRGRIQGSDVLPLLPFFVLGMGLGLLTALVEKYHVGAHGAEWSLSFVGRCLIAGRALWFYAAKLVWPTQLTFIYPRWEIDPAIGWQWLFPLAAIGVVAGLWLARGRIGRGPLAAVLFFGGTLGPALGFINTYPMRYSFVADHFQYLAGIGLITLCAAGLNRIPRVFPSALVLLLGVLTWHQTQIYRNPEILWRDTLAKNPDCWMAHNNLGVWLESQGDIEEAIQHYRMAIQINPKCSEALMALGFALYTEGRSDEGIQYYRMAIQADPNNFEALTDLGAALQAEGHIEEAIPRYRMALQINPNSFTALTDLGAALNAEGRFDEAITDLQRAVEINPDYSLALNDLAWVLATCPEARFRNGNEAVELSERACQLTDYKQPESIATLSAACAEAGRFEDAVAASQKAHDTALTLGQQEMGSRCQQLTKFFESRQPYREQASPPATAEPTAKPGQDSQHQ